MDARTSTRRPSSGTSASGPYTFPWAGSTWVSLPGFNTAGFVWDGLRDIGVFYTSQGSLRRVQREEPGPAPALRRDDLQRDDPDSDDDRLLRDEGEAHVRRRRAAGQHSPGDDDDQRIDRRHSPRGRRAHDAQPHEHDRRQQSLLPAPVAFVHRRPHPAHRPVVRPRLRAGVLRRRRHRDAGRVHPVPDRSVHSLRQPGRRGRLHATPHPRLRLAARQDVPAGGDPRPQSPERLPHDRAAFGRHQDRVPLHELEHVPDRDPGRGRARGGHHRRAGRNAHRRPRRRREHLPRPVRRRRR